MNSSPVITNRRLRRMKECIRTIQGKKPGRDSGPETKKTINFSIFFLIFVVTEKDKNASVTYSNFVLLPHSYRNIFINQGHQINSKTFLRRGGFRNLLHAKKRSVYHFKSRQLFHLAKGVFIQKNAYRPISPDDLSGGDKTVSAPGLSYDKNLIQ